MTFVRKDTHIRQYTPLYYLIYDDINLYTLVSLFLKQLVETVLRILGRRPSEELVCMLFKNQSLTLILSLM